MGNQLDSQTLNDISKCYHEYTVNHRDITQHQASTYHLLPSFKHHRFNIKSTTRRLQEQDARYQPTHIINMKNYRSSSIISCMVSMFYEGDESRIVVCHGNGHVLVFGGSGSDIQLCSDLGSYPWNVKSMKLTSENMLSLFNQKMIHTPTNIVPLLDSWLLITIKYRGEILVMNWKRKKVEFILPDDFGVIGDSSSMISSLAEIYHKTYWNYKKLILTFGGYIIAVYHNHIVIYQVSFTDQSRRKISKLSQIYHFRVNATGIEPLFNSNLLAILCKTQIKLWNLKTNQYQTILQSPLDEVVMDAAQLDISKLAVLSSSPVSSIISVWDLHTTKCIQRILPANSLSWSMNIYPMNSDTVLCLSDSAALSVCSISSRTFTQMPTSVGSFSVIPDSRKLIYDDEFLFLYNYPVVHRDDLSFQDLLYIACTGSSHSDIEIISC